jgi:hypothetical protein
MVIFGDTSYFSFFFCKSLEIFLCYCVGFHFLSFFFFFFF